MLDTPNKKILFVSEKVKKIEGPLIKKFKPNSKQIFKVHKGHKYLRTSMIRENKSDIFICEKVIQDKMMVGCTLCEESEILAKQPTKEVSKAVSLSEEIHKFEESKEELKKMSKTAIFQIAK